MLFPEPETSEAFYFSSANITDFLRHFYYLRKKHDVKNKKLIKILPDYCEHEKQSIIQAQKSFANKN